MTNVRDLTLALGGHWHGIYETAPCPVCQPEYRKSQNALTLADGASGLLLHCKKSACAFRGILAAAGIAPGAFTAPDPAMMAQREAERRRHADKRAGQALRLWRDTQPIGGMAAETYLREARGITCALANTLRFHPDCWHASANRFPALVALVALVEGAEGFAVHRT